MRAKTFVLIAVVSLSLLGVATFVYAIWALRPPRVFLPEGSTCDFGTLEEDSSFTKVFRIKNAGGRELRITSVRTSCGCTGAEVDREIVPRRQTANLKISYHARPLHSQERVSVVAATNDSQNPFVGFTISGKIRLHVFWSPQAVSFFRDATTRETDPKIVQISADDRELVIERIEISSDRVLVSQRRSMTGMELVFTLSPECPKGFRTETATLYLKGNAFEKQIKIPIYLMIG